METEIDVQRVRRVETRSGSTRFVLEDADGNEYTTFREATGEEAEKYSGRRALIAYHEEQRGSYRNVYLDRVSPARSKEGTGEATEGPARRPKWGGGRQ